MFFYTPLSCKYTPFKVCKNTHLFRKIHTLSCVKKHALRCVNLVTEGVLKILIFLECDNKKFSYFLSNKDKIPNLSKSSVVYEVTCPGCSATYIGKTERRLQTRLADCILISDQKCYCLLDSIFTTANMCNTLSLWTYTLLLTNLTTWTQSQLRT